MNPANAGDHRGDTNAAGWNRSHQTPLWGPGTSSKHRMWDRTLQPSNTKRKPQSTPQFAAFLHLTEAKPRYYWPLSRVSVETPRCSSTRCSWTKADVIWPSHKTGKHLCVEENREKRGKKRGRINGKLEKKKIWAELKGGGMKKASRGKQAVRQGRAPLPQSSLTSTNHSLFLFVCQESHNSHLETHCPINRKDFMEMKFINRVRLNGDVISPLSSHQSA